MEVLVVVQSNSFALAKLKACFLGRWRRSPAVGKIQMELFNCCLYIIQKFSDRETLLRTRITVANSNGVVFKCLKINRDATRSSDFVLSSVALPNISIVVPQDLRNFFFESHIHITRFCNKFGFIFEKRKHCRFYGCEVSRELEYHPRLTTKLVFGVCFLEVCFYLLWPRHYLHSEEIFRNVEIGIAAAVLVFVFGGQIFRKLFGKYVGLELKAEEFGKKVEEAEKETRVFMEEYKKLCEELLAIPVVCGIKTEKDKFAGAVYTTTVEALMPDGKALQMGTSHNLGQGFSKSFGITFLDKNSERKKV